MDNVQKHDISILFSFIEHDPGVLFSQSVSLRSVFMLFSQFILGFQWDFVTQFCVRIPYLDKVGYSKK
jgi:hypothetical protein